MRIPGALLVLLCLAAVAVAKDEEGLSKEGKRLLTSARSTARPAKLRDRQIEKFREKIAPVSTEEVLAVLTALRADEKPGKSQAGVLSILETEYALRRFGKEAAERIPGLFGRIGKTDPAILKELLGKSLMLEDLRLALAVALEAAVSEDEDVRMRAAVALGDLMDLGAATDDVRLKLTSLLDDPSPAVRALACRRAFRARLDAVYIWALENIDDPEKKKAQVLGEEVTLSPGAEALDGLKTLTRIQDVLVHKKFMKLPETEREVILNLYRTWWEDREERFPPPGFREARFRRVPSEVRAEVVPEDQEMTVIRFWSRTDRTKIRILVHELRAIPLTEFECKYHFAANYMAEGMRADTGEGWARNVLARHTWVLPRKAIGCYILFFQPLFDKRLKVHLRFHDPEF